MKVIINPQQEIKNQNNRVIFGNNKVFLNDIINLVNTREYRLRKYTLEFRREFISDHFPNQIILRKEQIRINELIKYSINLLCKNEGS